MKRIHASERLFSCKQLLNSLSLADAIFALYSTIVDSVVLDDFIFKILKSVLSGELFFRNV